MNNLFTESHLELVCPACSAKRTSKDTWKSEFWKHEHYLFDICPNCGYKIFIKSNINSSGIISSADTHIKIFENKTGNIEDKFESKNN